MLGYPSWVCADCCKEAGAEKVKTISSYHLGICDVCKNTKQVTEPRDWGYPNFNRIKKKKEE